MQTSSFFPVTNMRSFFTAPVMTLIACLCFNAVQAQVNEDLGYYTIRTQTGQLIGLQNHTGYNNSDPLIAEAPNTTRNTQIWKIERQSDNTYVITSVAGGKSWEVINSCRSRDGCGVVMWDRNLGPTQRWKITAAAGTNAFRIQLAANDKFFTMAPNGGAVPEGHITGVSNPATQTFFIEKSQRLVRLSGDFVDLRINQTPYKNQTEPSGERGGCTYFSTLAAVEAAYKKQGINVRLSEEFFAITSKMMGFHPFWPEITNADYRENQYAGTQGGGGMAILSSGLRIPESSVVPYGQYTVSADWANLNQRACNTYNFSVWNQFAEIPRARYYGVRRFTRISTISAINLETVLRQGKEIKVGIGGHAVLLVGFDKSNPADMRFLIKDSYGPTGQECYTRTQTLPYSQIGDMHNAEVVEETLPVNTWSELSAVGRWKINYDGWKGTLDIVRIPGLMNALLGESEATRRNGRILEDRRLGVFYDHTGRAHRVNGSITEMPNRVIQLRFRIDGATPNLRWDALQGREFIYYLHLNNPEYMAGTHRDPDGKTFGGYAVKDNQAFLATPSFNPERVNLESYANRSFNMRIGAQAGTIRFGAVTRSLAGSYIQGVFTNTRTRTTMNIQLATGAPSVILSPANTFVIREGNESSRNTGQVLFHSWEKGVLSGSILMQNSPNPVVMHLQ